MGRDRGGPGHLHGVVPLKPGVQGQPVAPLKPTGILCPPKHQCAQDVHDDNTRIRADLE